MSDPTLSSVTGVSKDNSASASFTDTGDDCGNTIDTLPVTMITARVIDNTLR